MLSGGRSHSFAGTRTRAHPQATRRTRVCEDLVVGARLLLGGKTLDQAAPLVAETPCVARLHLLDRVAQPPDRLPPLLQNRTVNVDRQR